MLRRMSEERTSTAKQVLTGYYIEHGVLPTVQVFAERMGYASTSSAHYTLGKLESQGFLVKEASGGRLMPGPTFVRTKPSEVEELALLPEAVLSVLPRGVKLSTMEVASGFKVDEAIWPGDLLILAPSERLDLSELLVLRRGPKFMTANEPRSGWTVHGVVVGQFRAHGR